MPYPRLEIASHLTSKEIEKRYKTCTHLPERERWQILSLVTGEGYACSAAEAAMIVKKTPGAVRKIINRYNKEGPTGLADRRKGRSGRKPVLSKGQRKKLYRSLQKESPDGGLWTGPKVARWVSEHAGVTVSKVTGWQYLRALGFTIQVPRPAHTQAATPAERTVWKKNP